jgi:hypothetical protein
LREVGVRFEPVSLFRPVGRSSATDALWQRAVTDAEVLQLDVQAAQLLLREPLRYMALELNTSEGDLTLDLELVDILTDEFSVLTPNAGSIPLPVSRHYQGSLRGLPGSLAAISIYDGEIMGLLATADGQWVLGRPEDTRDGKYLLYRAEHLRIPNPASCGTSDDDKYYRVEELSNMGGAKTIRCVRWYWEANHDLFLNKGTVTNTVN